MKGIVIERLNTSVRAYNILKRAGIDTLEDIFAVLDGAGIEGLLKIRNLGIRSSTEVLEIALKHGYDVIPMVEKYLAENKFSACCSFWDNRRQLWDEARDRLYVIAAKQQ